MKSILTSWALLGFLVLTVACSNDDDVTPTVEPDLLMVAEAAAQGIRAEVYAEEPLFVGYNRLQLSITDDEGNPLSGNIAINPVMDMGPMDHGDHGGHGEHMEHSCPHDYPDGPSVKNGTVLFNVAFVMPSGELGTWALNVTFQGKTVEVPIAVIQPEWSKMVSFTHGPEESKTGYFVFLVEPRAPQVGQNDLQLAIYKRANMFDWPPVDGLEVEMTPWMPSMDHGSPNNVDPKDTGNGMYLGKVNFTMTGDWQIRLKIINNGVVSGEPTFDLEF